LTWQQTPLIQWLASNDPLAQALLSQVCPFLFKLEQK